MQSSGMGFGLYRRRRLWTGFGRYIEDTAPNCSLQHFQYAAYPITLLVRQPIHGVSKVGSPQTRGL